MGKVTQAPISLIYLLDELSILEGLQISSTNQLQKKAYQDGIDAINRIITKVKDK